jgi:hypothetical protein
VRVALSEGGTRGKELHHESQPNGIECATTPLLSRGVRHPLRQTWRSSRGSHCLHHCDCTTLIVGIATAVVAIPTAVVAIPTALKLAPYGPLGILPVGDVNVEPRRVFTKLQA